MKKIISEKMIRVLFWVLVYLLCVLVVQAFTACKQNGNTQDGDIKIEFFKASPDTINLGEKSTLSWGVSGIDTVIINGNIGQVPAMGELDVYPTSTTDYKLTAGNAFATVKVTVKPPANPGPAEIVYFKADDYSVSVYQIVKISWSVTKAIVVKVSGIGNVGATGSREKKFDYTENVVLEAQGSDEQWVSQSFKISVDRRSACEWFGSGSYGWSYPSPYICKVVTQKNGSPYYAAKNLTFKITLYDSSNNIIDGGTGVIPVILPGDSGVVLIDLPNGKGALADHVVMVLSRCDCELINPY